MARGGYQRPTNPAPVSGPGQLSRRTDGGPSAPRQPIRALPDAAYGEQATYQEDQRGAPMAAGASPVDTPMPSPADLSSVVPFGEATQRPGEAVTSGAATGAGPGPEALGLGRGAQDDPVIQYMVSALPMLELASNLPFAGPEFKQFVRRLRASS